LKSPFKIAASSPRSSLSSRISAVSSHSASACRAACLCWNRVATRVAGFYTPALEISPLPEQTHSGWKERANYFMLRGAIKRNLSHSGQIALLKKRVR